MKKIIRYEHKCKRCLNTFVSKTKKPIACGKCKSAYWDVKPQPKPVAQDSAAA
jgi:ribosomal protein S27AE